MPFGIQQRATWVRQGSRKTDRGDGCHRRRAQNPAQVIPKRTSRGGLKPDAQPLVRKGDQRLACREQRTFPVPSRCGEFPQRLGEAFAKRSTAWGRDRNREAGLGSEQTIGGVGPLGGRPRQLRRQLATRQPRLLPNQRTPRSWGEWLRRQRMTLTRSAGRAALGRGLAIASFVRPRVSARMPTDPEGSRSGIGGSVVVHQQVVAAARAGRPGKTEAHRHQTRNDRQPAVAGFGIGYRTAHVEHFLKRSP